MIEHDHGPELGAPCGAGSVLSLPLVETSPGVYETWWQVTAELAPAVYNVVGCLTVAGQQKAATPAAVLIVQPPPPPPPSAAPPGPTAPPAGPPTPETPPPAS